MKRVSVRTLSALLCAVLLLALASGCAGTGSDVSNTTTSSTSSTSSSSTIGTTTSSSAAIADPSGNGDNVTVSTDDVTTVPSDDGTTDVQPSSTTGATTTNGTSIHQTVPTSADKTTAGTNKTTSGTKKTTTKATTTAKTTITSTTAGTDTDEKVLQLGSLTVYSKSTPYVSGNLEITVLLPTKIGAENMDKQAFTKAYEQHSGIKVNYNFYKHSDIFVLKSTMLNSGAIPDIFVSVSVGFKCSEVEKYGKQGFFADLTDLLPTWAPNVYKKLHSGNYEYGRLAAYAPGKVYALPSLELPANDPNREYLEAVQPMINTAWLDELGLEIPKTTQEFYEVCKAFTEEDPDGNGKNDTFGFGAPLIYPQFWNPWGLGMDWYAHGVITEKGEVLSAPLTDNFREGIRFYNRMWEEGMMCKKMFGSNGKPVVGAALKSLVPTTGIIAYRDLPSYLTDSELKNWSVMAWPEAPNTGDLKAGIAYVQYADSLPNSFMISSRTKSPEACLRWLDHFYTADGAMLWRYGPKGVAYMSVGNSYKLKKNTETLAANQNVPSSVLPMSPVNVLSRNASEQTAREQNLARYQKEGKAVNKAARYSFDRLRQLATEEEDARIAKLKDPGLWTWGEQAIRGEEVDVEVDWNSYKTTYSADYAQWKQIYQNIFDRYFK